MHSSLKIVCNKENGGGVGNLMFLKFLISLLKWYLPTAVSFITASHTLTKRVLQSILLLRLSFLKIAFTFHFFCRNFRMSDILAEPLFDWFINILRLSTFSCKEKKINNYSLSLYKPISFMKMSSEKNQYLLRYSLPHYPALYCVQLLFAICSHNIRFLLWKLKRYLARWKRFLPFRKC